MRHSNSLLRINTTISQNTWATIVELMVVLAILWLWITGLLQMISWWIGYARDTENNIKAINIAREGIEAVTNIRDTNWLRFSSDKGNCWKVNTYQSGCIGTPGYANLIADGYYTISSNNWLWFLSGAATLPISPWTPYKNSYPVRLDNLGFYTQSWGSIAPCTSSSQINCTTIFTREIYIQSIAASTWSVRVVSTARWLDKRPQSVIIETILTNWKANF